MRAAGNGRVTGKQERAILALLVEPTIQAAAKTAGVGERTLFTWLKDERFTYVLRHARYEAMQRTVSRLQQASVEAVDTLLAVMSEANATAAVRVSAAKSVLDLALKASDMDELERRICALEAQAGSQEQPREDAQKADRGARTPPHL